MSQADLNVLYDMAGLPARKTRQPDTHERKRQTRKSPRPARPAGHRRSRQS